MRCEGACGVPREARAAPADHWRDAQYMLPNVPMHDTGSSPLLADAPTSAPPLLAFGDAVHLLGGEGGMFR